MGRIDQQIDRFLSTSVNPVDRKGRVSVPAHFRIVLKTLGIEQLYALRALDVPALNVGGLDRLARFEARIAEEDPFFGSGDDLSYHLHGDGTFLKVDGEGRLALTDFMRDQTGITDEVAFVGRGDFFQIWQPAALQTYADAVRARLRARRAGQSEAGQ